MERHDIFLIRLEAFSFPCPIMDFMVMIIRFLQMYTIKHITVERQIFDNYSSKGGN